MRSLWTFGLLVVIAICIIPIQAQAFQFEETVTIEEGDYHSKSFKVEGATLLRLRFTSETGQMVDLLFLTVENVDTYLDGQPFDHEGDSVIGAIAVEKDFMLLPGDYYFVIDNSERVGTVPSGDVRASYQFKDYFPLGDLFDIILPITVTAVLAVVMVIIILIVFQGRKDRKNGDAFNRQGDDFHRKM